MKTFIFISFFIFVASKSMMEFGLKEFPQKGSTWINELGSILTIEDIENGTLFGVYESKVGKVSGSYKVVGTYNNSDKRKTIAWTVSWVNDVLTSGSITAWSGYFKPENNTIVTTWILTKGDSAEWDSTLINKDIFHLKKSQ